MTTHTTEAVARRATLAAVLAMLGTMNVGYVYRGADDTKSPVAQAVALRDELQARMVASPALDELDP